MDTKMNGIFVWVDREQMRIKQHLLGVSFQKLPTNITPFSSRPILIAIRTCVYKLAAGTRERQSVTSSAKIR